jgi:hypothetical protein
MKEILKMIDEKRLATPPVQHIRNLMESIKDGKLAVTYYDPIDPPNTVIYDVSCTALDADEMVERYESLVNTIESVNKARKNLKKGEKLEDVLTLEQYEVWNTYIRGFDEFDAGDYDLNEIYDMKFGGVQLSDEEQAILDRHYEWFEEQCYKRLPKKVYSPSTFIERAQRYEFFFDINAPEIVMNETGRRLAEEMILYNYCV